MLPPYPGVPVTHLTNQRLFFALRLSAAVLALACTGSTGPSTTPPPPLLFLWPVAPENRSAVTTGFGEYIPTNIYPAKFHSGIDIGKRTPNDQAVAAAAGTVEKIQRNDGSDRGEGNVIIVRHSSTVFTQYSHLAVIDPTLDLQCDPSGTAPRVTCKTKVDVVAGQPLGTIGGTGVGLPDKWPPHLHFEIKSKPLIGVDGMDDDHATGYGYTLTAPRFPPAPPAQAYYVTDPMLALYQGTAVNQTISLADPNTLGVGPGLVFPSTGAQVRPMDYHVLAKASSAGCPTPWVMVESPDPPPTGTTFKGTLGNFDKSYFPDGWICPTLGDFYAVGLTGAASSSLYLVDPRQTGIDLPVAPVSDVASGLTLALLDVETSLAGDVYAVSDTRLWHLDPATGLASLVLTFPPIVGGANAWADDKRGTLFAATTPYGQIFTLDVAAKSAKEVGRMNPLLQAPGTSGDLVFLDDGTLLAVQQGSPNDVLVRLDPANGYLATPVKAGVTLGIPRVWGLHRVGSKVYALAAYLSSGAAGGLYDVDVNAGTATWIRDLSFPPTGAAPPTR